MKLEESKNEIMDMGHKTKHSYQYDLLTWGGNKAVMKPRKSITAKFSPLMSGHALLAPYSVSNGSS
jgi:hypothetical protein